jgi:cyclopropane-fatty-acyl-phospholipid synthase
LTVTDERRTIAPPDLLAVRARHFRRLARRFFLRVVAPRHLDGFGTLELHERWGRRDDSRVVGHGELRADLTVHDVNAYAALVYGGSKGLGRSYVNGLWDTSDITQLIRYLFRATQPSRRRLDVLARRWRVLLALLQRSGPSKDVDRENIHAHYDLSNEFFALMLDETMAYSCAIFVDASTTLHEAQVEKFDRICRKLELGPGDHVIEIGTGWGGFAIHAASRYGARVTTTTISQSQRLAALARVRAAGLEHLITVLGDHYDDLSGTYDALVSVEMIEAVNWRRYDQFFAKCSSLLNDRGRMVLQAITIADQSFDRAKLRDDFIRDLIFPGGCLPSVAAIMDAITRTTDLRAVSLDDIGLHYATTIDRWRRAVHEKCDAVTQLGFDDRFRRLWDLYLGYCEAAFLERHVSDVQFVFHKPATVTV